jgi:hypothetical protein
MGVKENISQFGEEFTDELRVSFNTIFLNYFKLISIYLIIYF